MKVIFRDDEVRPAPNAFLLNLSAEIFTEHSPNPAFVVWQVTCSEPRKEYPRPLGIDTVDTDSQNTTGATVADDVD